MKHKVTFEFTIDDEKEVNKDSLDMLKEVTNNPGDKAELEQSIREHPGSLSFAGLDINKVNIKVGKVTEDNSLLIIPDYIYEYIGESKEKGEGLGHSIVDSYRMEGIGDWMAKNEELFAEVWLLRNKVESKYKEEDTNGTLY